ncbi:hypothetical protein M422DRAFT_191354, partial [Sphaerobolus stellatus SS14]
LYLQRHDLLKNPRGSTPWQRLYHGQNNRAFITTMGFDIVTFNILMNMFAPVWNTNPIPHEDTKAGGVPRIDRCSLDAAGALGLTLHYLNATTSQITLQQVFALVPATLSCYLNFSLKILHCVASDIPEAKIRWPTAEEMEEFMKIIGERHPALIIWINGTAYGAFGSIDGLKPPTASADDSEWQNATFNGWLHSNVTNCVIAYSPRGDIIACHLNASGSWHDSCVAQPIYQKLWDRTPHGYFLLGDTAFPHGTEQIDKKIKAPIKSGQQLPSDRTELENLLCLNRQLLSYHQTAE